jgi:uncharacterized protein (TIGR02231 family)
LSARLQARAAPLLEPVAYLHALSTLAGDLPIFPGEAALYRDDIFVGKEVLPQINVGEAFDMGFGVDEQMEVKRVELSDSKGQQGLIKSEDTLERHYRLKAINHHSRMMPVRLLDRIPVAYHDKIKVELLSDQRAVTEQNVKDRRGVIAFEAELKSGQETAFDLHYRISWPKGERINQV